jgi:hypothetical protein
MAVLFPTEDMREKKFRHEIYSTLSAMAVKETFKYSR